MNAFSHEPFQKGAPAPEPEVLTAAASGERRKGPRRAPRSNRNLAGSGPTSLSIHPPQLLSREWSVVATVMAACLIIMGLSSSSVPPVYSLAAALAAIAVIVSCRLMFAPERLARRGFAGRFLVMQTLVALPQALFGFAISNWAYSNPAVGWVAVVGAMAIVSTAAAVVLNGRLPAVLASIIALWLPVVALNGSLPAWLMLIAGVASCLVAAMRQQRVESGEQFRQQEIERRQVRAEEILADYEQSGQGWFWETDRRGMIAYVSSTVGQLLGRDVFQLNGRPLSELFIVDPEARDGERTLNFHLSARSSFSDVAVRANIPEEERWWSISGRPVHDSYGNFLGFRGSGSDLTEKRLSQERATRLAHYDSLTGLSNRFQMSQTLDKILDSVGAEHRQCAVLLLDLDRFKQVNDTMGHPVGDVLLRQVAQRLQGAVGDNGRVGRLGGDEFKVILPGRTARQQLGELANRIIDQLSQPYLIEGHRVVIGASVGIAIAPDDGQTSEALIRNADLALYAAKDGGRGRYHFYAPDLLTDAEERRHLEQDLRDALSEGGLELHYQPVVETATEKITGIKLVCKDYSVRSASLGHDAQGEVSLEVDHKGQTYRGRGVSVDTVEATVRAILNAVNRISLTHDAPATRLVPTGAIREAAGGV